MGVMMLKLATTVQSISYLDSNGGPSAHTDTFMKGYNAGYRKCLTSSSPVAPNAGDNNTLPNKDQLTSSSNITSGHPLNYSLGSNEPVSDYDKGCSDVKHGDNQYLLQLGAKRLTNNSTGGYNDGFHSCFYEHIECVHRYPMMEVLLHT